MFERDNFKRSIISAIGAIILSTTAISAAVGPARAVETAPVQVALAQDLGAVDA